ncbi:MULTISPECIES: hypothetical protein [unclassified Aurantimonas]|uniref:hypothetical protein n=1 Tax=unclassified Aurantimonas TaxID=2638230 RepID=UPI002E18CDAD|nr:MULTISPECIES: hypothetical protein [unclassified Aurantimonas]MEC5293076.1 hypothetical protein [Aurantimonas sp. C2-3-R2]MEC5414116.1 hypothetical protein [Aurantimonas sp. C2-4-R8]
MARSKRRRRRSSGRAVQVLVGVLLVLACIGVGGAYAWLSMTTERSPNLVADTLCPVDGPRSVTVVLLDSSDDIPDVGRRQLTTFLQDLADGMPEYGLLELRLLDPAVDGGRVVFSKCNPGNGSNLSELVANPAAVRRRWTETFQAPLQEALDSGLASSEADRSPIMETIQRIAVDRFDGNAVRDVEKRLILVSDMIEHGPAYSQYRDGVSFEAFQRLPARDAYATNLHGAKVIVRYVQRASARFDSGEHIRFWTDWIKTNGGNIVDAEKVQGAG